MIRRRIPAILAALVLLGAAAAGRAQPPAEPEVLARRLLEVSGAGQLGVQMMNQMIASFRQSEPEVPAAFWDELASQVDPSTLTDLVVPVYTRHLTVEEMQAAIAFYETPAGQAIIRKMPLVLQESFQVGQQWGMELAQKAQQLLRERERE